MNICSKRSFAQRLPSVRSAALVLCVVFVSAFILSSGFIFSHAEHTHDTHGSGGSCATCAHLAAAEKMLNTVTLAAVCAALVLGFRFVRGAVLKPAACRTDAATLIRLKVRLNY
jgi:hypothetical protein